MHAEPFSSPVSVSTGFRVKRFLFRLDFVSEAPDLLVFRPHKPFTFPTRAMSSTRAMRRLLRRSQPIPRCLLALLSVALFSTATTAPVAAQDPGAPSDDPSVEAGGFEEIDGTTLEPATLSYDATMKMNGQSQDLSSTLRVSATSTSEADTWTLVSRIKTTRGIRTDSLIMGRSSLLPVSRHVRGRGEMDLTYTGPSAPGEPRSGEPASGGMEVSGTMKRKGQSKPISKSLNGPTLAAGVHDVIALGAMPLQPGFEATLRVFSPQDQATKRAKFEVTGTKTVETPAGSFETYVVDLNVGDGQVTGTVHLRKEVPHYYVKWETEVSTNRGARTIIQNLSSMEMGAPSSAQ